MVVTMEMYEEIRAYHNQGRSIRWIAKRMRISRQTVKKYCKGETIPGVRKEYHRESDVVTEDIKFVKAYVLFIISQFSLPSSINLSISFSKYHPVIP